MTFDDELYAQFYKGDVKLAVLKAIRFKLEEKNRLCPLPGNLKHTAIIITKNISAAGEVSIVHAEVVKEKLLFHHC